MAAVGVCGIAGGAAGAARGALHPVVICRGSRPGDWNGGGGRCARGGILRGRRIAAWCGSRLTEGKIVGVEFVV